MKARTDFAAPERPGTRQPARNGPKRRPSAILALVAATPLLFVVPIVHAQIAIVDVNAVAKGYRASKLIGSTVLNEEDKRVATIDDLVIDRDEHVLYAVLDVGGFLGIGHRLVAVPYESLQLSEDGMKIVLPGATKKEVEGLPVFEYK